VAPLRTVKEPEELEVIQQRAGIVDRAMARIRGSSRHGD